MTFEEERRFKAEKFPEICNKLRKVVAHLEGWTLEIRHNEVWNVQEAEIHGKDGQKVKVAVLDYESWRIELVGTFARSRYSNRVRYTMPRITASLKRRADIVARDIQKRLLNDYAPAYLEHKKDIDDLDNYDDEQRAFLHSTADSLDIDHCEMNKNVSGDVEFVINDELYPSVVKLTVSTQLRGERRLVNIEMMHVPAKAFEAFAKSYLKATDQSSTKIIQALLTHC